MNKWNKIVLGLTVAVTASAAGFAITACNKGPSTIDYSFVVDEDQTIVVSGAKGENVEFPEVSKDGYIFKGWYLDEEYAGSPVASATFESSVTYYAKWVVGYEITLDLNGGYLENSSKLYLEAGANIYAFMQDYVPTYGEYQFGCWYVGDEPLKTVDKMTSAGVTLTARYKAEYTVNVYLQNTDLETDLATYELSEEYSSTGYALIGEEYEPDIDVEGFSRFSSDDTSLIIDGDKTKNVFEFHYDRNRYTLILNANYPDGTVERVQETHYYGVPFEVPENPFEYEGCRFLGWATRDDAGYDDVVKGEYALERNTAFYVVWNVGYTDMFSGSDYIFLDYDVAGKATLCRGGVDIEGAYNEKKDIYVFNGTDFTLNAKLNADGTFVYYSNRKGSYDLLTNEGKIDTNYGITLDDANGLTYISRVGDGFVKTGTYTIDADGNYVATVTDLVSGEVSTFYFIVSEAYDSSGNVYNVFKIRGDEFNYGSMAKYVGGSLYYPVITLSGFGTATYQTIYGTSTYFYTMSDDIVTIQSLSTSLQVSVICTIRVKNVNGTYCYEDYNSAYDVIYTNGEATLTLDGCSTAVYTDGSITVTGTFSVASSYLGEYVVTVTSNGKNYVYLTDTVTDGDTGVESLTFTEKSADYAEYIFADTDGYLKPPYLAVNGDGTASLYELNSEQKAEAVSTGSFVKQGYSYLYTVTGAVADWATAVYTELELVIDTASTSYHIFYLLSSKTGSEETRYATEYTNADGSTLVKTEYFLIYEDSEGNVISGLYTDNTEYVQVTSGSATYYFTLVEGESNTFRTLSTPPLIVYALTDGVKDETRTLTISGNSTDGKYDAVYAENEVRYEGYYTYDKVNTLGVSAYIYTFVSNDGAKTFKFTVSSSSSVYYFTYYETDAVITVGTLNRVEDDLGISSDVTIAVTDTQDAVVYSDGVDSYHGAVSSESVSVFGNSVTVYTFTAADGSLTLRFTLLSDSNGSYFRISGADASYTAADGGTLDLDGATHIAKYTDANGVSYYNYYWTATNVLDEAEPAVEIYIDNVARFFDLKESDHTFALRGLEKGSYIRITNGYPDALVTLDGHGHAVFGLFTEDVETVTEVSATYTQSEGVYTFTFAGDVKLVGVLGTFNDGSTVYNAFYAQVEGAEGTYLNESDLSVLILDRYGKVVKYDSYGVKRTGSYTVVEEGLFFYEDDDQTEFALYSYADGKIVAQTYEATYYADDFSSVVFHSYGIVEINNSIFAYFTYDAANGKYVLYSPDTEGNAYGFSTEELYVSDDTVTYTVNGSAVTYRYFDGFEITLTDENGNTLEFTPTGESTFTVLADYTETSGTTDQYYIVVDYDDEGNPVTYLAKYQYLYVNGSKYGYKTLFKYDFSMSLTDLSFGFDAGSYVTGMVLYDYSYLYMSSYTSSTSILQSFYGALSIVGTESGEGTQFSVSGAFNYVTGTDGEKLTFTGGTLSNAGYYNSYYGNLFTCEFVGSDGETYHLSFFLTVYSNKYCFITYALTRVTDSFAIDAENDTVVYEEELVNTLFSFTKEESEEGTVEYYRAGDKFYPSLKYKGEIVCVSGWDIQEGEWTFISCKYAVTTYTNYYYVFSFTQDEAGNLSDGAVAVLKQTIYSAGSIDAVSVLEDIETGEKVEISALLVNGTVYVATDCVKNEDGSFTVTCEGATFKVTFTTTGEGDQATTTATIEDVTEEETETPAETLSD